MDWAEQEAALEEKRELKFDSEKLSDQDLLKIIKERIASSPYFNAEHIEVSAHKGEVTLKGRVDTEANKIRLRELIESMPNVNLITNLVQVQPSM